MVRSVRFLHNMKLPPIFNEPVLGRSIDFSHFKPTTIKVPHSNGATKHYAPFDHNIHTHTTELATEKTVNEAINNALEARKTWSQTPFHTRAAIFLKAASLLAGKYRNEMLAATIMTQGKNPYQAEIDAVCELADFWRFNVKFAQQIYEDQPISPADTWNSVIYRPLEGFIYAVSPFNFTAIGGNLCCAPALLGNVVLWKPSPSSTLSNQLIYKILLEAGLPQGVIQFVPGDAKMISDIVLRHKDFAGLHFTGSSTVFQSLWKQIADNLSSYRAFPRIVGETGGKNMHFIHQSADITSAAYHTIRGAFEYSGQKCSATSRLYVPASRAKEFESLLCKAHKEITLGDPRSTAFMGPVIHKESWKNCQRSIELAKDHATIIAGGRCDDSKGWFVEPTIVKVNSVDHPLMAKEIFGPVLAIFEYPDEEYTKFLHIANETSPYALTCALFASDRDALELGRSILRDAAGNLYINEKSTGAVVGQQPFGGARLSGTNDKAGSLMNLYRWLSPQACKETFVPLKHFQYTK